MNRLNIEFDKVVDDLKYETIRKISDLAWKNGGVVYDIDTLKSTLLIDVKDKNNINRLIYEISEIEGVICVEN